MPSDLYERISKTARDFAHSYDQDKCSGDITALSATLTPTCRRYFAPTSLLAQAPGLQAGQSNTEFEAQTEKELTTLMESWTVEIIDLIVDETAKKAVVRSVNRATSRWGKTYPFDNVFTLFLTQDGTKIEKIVQFVDLGIVGQLLQDEKEFANALQ